MTYGRQPPYPLGVRTDYERIQWLIDQWFSLSSRLAHSNESNRQLRADISSMRNQRADLIKGAFNITAEQELASPQAPVTLRIQLRPAQIEITVTDEYVPLRRWPKAHRDVVFRDILGGIEKLFMESGL